MIGVVTPRDFVRDRALIELRQIKTDRISLKFIRQLLGGERRDYGRINPAAQADNRRLEAAFVDVVARAEDEGAVELLCVRLRISDCGLRIVSLRF